MQLSQDQPATRPTRPSTVDGQCLCPGMRCASPDAGEQRTTCRRLHSLEWTDGSRHQCTRMIDRSLKQREQEQRQADLPIPPHHTSTSQATARARAIGQASWEVCTRSGTAPVSREHSSREALRARQSTLAISVDRFPPRRRAACAAPRVYRCRLPWRSTCPWARCRIVQGPRALGSLTSRPRRSTTSSSIPTCTSRAALACMYVAQRPHPRPARTATGWKRVCSFAGTRTVRCT